MIASQTVAMVLQGVPAFYLSSFFGQPNAHDWVEQTGRARSINRKKYDLDEAEQLAGEEGSTSSLIFNELKRRLLIRSGERSFNPAVAQKVVDLHPSVFALERGSILTLANLADSDIRVQIPPQSAPARDLLDGTAFSSTGIPLGPYQCRWLRSQGNETGMKP